MPGSDKLLAWSSHSYEPRGEEKLREIEHPLDFEVLFDGKPWKPARGNYDEFVDLRTGEHVAHFMTTQGAMSVRTAFNQAGEIVSQFEVDATKVKTLDIKETESKWSRTVTPSVENKSRRLRVVTVSREAPELAQPSTQADLTDIEIDGPIEDQVAIRSFLYHLRTAQPLSPFGLSNSTYFGHTFWDQDTWIFPVLALLDPAGGQRLLNYRIARLGQAHQNALDWIAAERPTARGKLGRTEVRGNPLMFPWESSVTGKETVPGESKFEHHVSGSVARAFGMAKAFGLCDPAIADKVINGVGDFYRLRVTGGEIKGVMSPDEFFIGNNDLYTNLVAQWCMNGGKFEGSTKLKLPKDDKTFLTYDEDRLKGYKQAAAVLSIYPLQFPEAERQGAAMMERFEDKVTKSGPAMTDSIHALIWARLGDSEKAYTTWKKSWKEFVKGPFLNFSEKRSKDSSYFYTGAAGCLQTVLYGFLGFRLDSNQAPGAVWSKQCPGNWLSIKPTLPKAWKSLKLKGFSFQGQRYTLTVTSEGTQVEPFAQPASPMSTAKE